MRFLAAIGVLAICVAIAGAVYFYGGFFNVAASADGNPVVEWSLRSVREASIDKHFTAPSPPAWFSTPQAMQEGAHEVAQEGCVDCHGAPGRKPDRFAQGLNPNPPDLGDATKDDPPAKVFWTIKNGIRMTGMPAFGSHMTDDEIWRAVAFVQHEESVTPAQYDQWSKAGEKGDKGEAGKVSKAPAAGEPAAK